MQRRLGDQARSERPRLQPVSYPVQRDFDKHCEFGCVIDEKSVTFWLHAIALHLRSDNGTELGSLDSNVPVCTTADGSDLAPDVFSFSITIGPDHQEVRIAGFLLEIAFHLLEVLFRQANEHQEVRPLSHISLTSVTKVLIGASNKANGSQLYHFRYSSGKSFKSRLMISQNSGSSIRGTYIGCEMSEYRCHCELRVSSSRSVRGRKVVDKVIVSDISMGGCSLGGGDGVSTL